MVISVAMSISFISGRFSSRLRHGFPLQWPQEEANVVVVRQTLQGRGVELLGCLQVPKQFAQYQVMASHDLDEFFVECSDKANPPTQFAQKARARAMVSFWRQKRIVGSNQVKSARFHGAKWTDLQYRYIFAVRYLDLCGVRCAEQKLQPIAIAATWFF